MDHQATCVAIQSATTEEQVIAAVRAYLASLSAKDAASMPAALVALARSHAENIVEAALHLVNAEMTTASQRLAMLAAYKA